VVVQRDLSRLTEQFHELFPGEAIVAQSNGKDLVLSGTVSNKDIADKAVNLAAGYVDKKDEVVNLLSFQGNAASNQVLLRVRFAEVSRSAMTELGVSLFTSPTGVKNTLGRTATDQVPAPGFSDLAWSKASSNFGSDVTSATGKFTFSDFLNLFLFSEKYDLGAMVRALQTKGLFQSLAEPNLVAESGKEASFLAGGEFPIPIAQQSGGGTAITVMFKEFGVRLTFTPTVNGDRVRLKVKPEVSTLDFTNAVTLQGFRIPALSTRKTETEVELQDGQTFAIAGLLNNTMTSSLQKIPGIGDIPILGLLFRSKAAQKNQTELVVMITPQILPRTSPGVTPNMPRLVEPYLPPLPPKKGYDSPPAAFPTGRSQQAQPEAAVPPAVPQQQSATTPTPADAARTMSGLTPSAPKKMESTPEAAPAVRAPEPAVTRPLTPAEMKTLERVRREERERAVQAAKIAEVQREKAAKDKVQQDKVAREQARRDAEAAKRQAEIDKKHQKAIDEAQAKLKAAEAAYKAETIKKDKQ
jgi:pilus assembly protein CpaC